MEQDVKAAAKAAAAAELQGTPASLNGQPNLGALKDSARLSPAIAFASAKGLLPIPVNGTRIRSFGGSGRQRWPGKGHFHRHKARGAGHNTLVMAGLFTQDRSGATDNS